MARRPEVRYWKTRGLWVDEAGQFRRGGYWTTINGKKRPLALGPKDAPAGPTYLKALQEFRDLLAMENAPGAGDRNTCRVVCEYYMRSLAETATEGTVALRQEYLGAFCETEMGDWQVAKLTPFAVQRWLSEMRQPRLVKLKLLGHKGEVTRKRQWGDGGVRIAVASIKAAFNYAARYGLIGKNPVSALVAPPQTSRARGCIVRPELHEVALQRSRGQFREALVCLQATGCRPSELLRATAADWDERLCAIVYHARSRRRPGEGTHKTAAKEKERRIFFTGEAAVIMRRRVRDYPRGRLWRNPRKPHLPYAYRALRNNFESLGKRLGVPGLSAMSYRHTFATVWLEGGGSIDDLAEMMGNTPEVIRHHYAHLCDNVDRLRKLAEGFSEARTQKPPDVLPFGKAAQ